MPARTRPDYGIDAPGVIRNLAVIGITLAVAGILVRRGIPAGRDVVLRISPALWCMAVVFLGEAGLMILYAKVGKFAHRDRMLALHDWTGSEHALDVGTGRGLMLVGVARRLTTGRAEGIDIWRTEDLTGNTAAATQRNLDLEGVSDRTRLHDMPAQAMTFADGTFDVVVSNLCLHNIEDRAVRDQACREIVRVMKPGGVALISDFRHTAQYVDAMREGGCEAHRTALNLLTFPPLRTVIARKPAS